MSDLKDTRGGAYEPVSDDEKPRPHQGKTRVSTEQSGAGDGLDPQPGRDGKYPLPTGLERERKGPLNAVAGRGNRSA